MTEDVEISRGVAKASASRLIMAIKSSGTLGVQPGDVQVVVQRLQQVEDLVDAYVERDQDIHRLVKQLDVEFNGRDAAERPSLVDLMGEPEKLRKKIRHETLLQARSYILQMRIPAWGAIVKALGAACVNIVDTGQWIEAAGKVMRARATRLMEFLDKPEDISGTDFGHITVELGDSALPYCEHNICVGDGEVCPHCDPVIARRYVELKARQDARRKEAGAESSQGIKGASAQS